eukprot:scaffold1549_cov105-Cylindrotheca_fusiformis.AAC.12
MTTNGAHQDSPRLLPTSYYHRQRIYTFYRHGKFLAWQYLQLMECAVQSSTMCIQPTIGSNRCGEIWQQLNWYRSEYLNGNYQNEGLQICGSPFSSETRPRNSTRVDRRRILKSEFKI